jgi:TctA family transporter
VRDYASHFAETMFGEGGPKDDEEFARLLEESMSRADALEKRIGYFATGSRGLSAAGLFLGPLPSVGALAADYAAEKTRKALAKAKWYEFGPQVRKAATLAEIKLQLNVLDETTSTPS